MNYLLYCLFKDNFVHLLIFVG